MMTAFLLESQERSKALSFCSSNDESCVAPSKEIVPGLTTRVLDWLGYKAACTVFQYDFSEIKSCGCRIDSDLDAFSILFRLVYMYVYIYIYVIVHIHYMHTHVSVMIKPGSSPQHHCAAPLRSTTAQSAEVDSTAFGMEEMEAFWRRNRKALRRARADQLVHNWSIFRNGGRVYDG